ncbi:MAG: DNA repair exonuclease [Clostridiales bacterium]|nr:DNA repair exonuclease [Clostridiales bacterium]
MPFTSLGPDSGKSSQRRQEQKKIFAGITACAAAEKAELLVVSGDLYEHGYVRESTLNHVSGEFAKLGDTRILLIAGNHDPIVPGCGYRNTVWPDNVHILEEGGCYTGLEDRGVRVYAGPAAKFEPSVDNRFINILLLHGSLDTAFDKNAFNPVTSADLKRLGMDYIALGHFHNKLMAGGADGRVYNPGSPMALGFDEAGEHGWFVGEISKSDIDNGSGCQSTVNMEFVRSGGRAYHRRDWDIKGCRSDEDIIAAISSDGFLKNHPEDLFYITLKGYAAGRFKPDTATIASGLAEEAFFIKVSDETIPDYDFAEIAGEPGLRGAFTRRLLQMLEQEEGNEKKELVRKALYYGLEALDQGEIL